MKKSDLILLFDDIYIEGIATFILIISLHYRLMFILLAVYLCVFYKKIFWLRLFFLSSVIILSFYIIDTKTNDSHITGDVKVSYIDEYETYQRLHITYKHKTYFYYVYEDTFDIGDHFYLDADIEYFEHESIPFGFDYDDYYISKGIYGKISVIDMGEIQPGFHINKLRYDLEKNNQNAYVKSLIFGQSMNDDKIEEAYDCLQLSFLLQVSGIHIFVFMMFMQKVLFNLNIKQNMKQVIICMLYLCLIYLSNYDLSIIRLCLSYMLIIGNKKFELRLLSIDRLFIVFFILVMLDINLLYSQAFLLVFIIILMLDLTSYLYQKLSLLTRRYVMSFIVLLSLLPFQNQISLLYIFIAPFMMIWMSYVMYPLTWVIFIFPKLTFLMNHLSFLTIDIIEFIYNDHFIIYFHSFNIWYKIIIYGLTLYLLTAKHTTQILKRLIIYIIICFLPTFAFKQINSDLFYMLNVGQGDGFYIKSEDTHLVVDCFDQTTYFLKNHGITKIDYLILTHSDEDHIKEAVEIIYTFDVELVILSAYDMGYPHYDANIMRAKAGDFIELNNQKVYFYNPIIDYGDSNNNALVFKIHIGDYDILMTGDIESTAENKIVQTYQNQIQSDVIKIAHHGSDTSSINTFIEMVNPSYALISVGKNNRYEFPSIDVIERLEQRHIDIYRTDIDGTVFYRYYFGKGKWRTYL
ncbi:MAG: ComEC/Rec2 family competence protein [Acholeplasmataceae bacterium]